MLQYCCRPGGFGVSDPADARDAGRVALAFMHIGPVQLID